MTVTSTSRNTDLFRPHEKIGEYVVIERISHGSIAQVYKARQSSLKRVVAVKVLTERAALEPAIIRRFEQEAMIVAQLKHPNIVHVIDRGVDRNRCFFVMDFVHGMTLKKIMADGEFPLGSGINILLQVLKALDYAHSNGIIHKDIRPSNILIENSGNALIADFGIAQMIDKERTIQTRSNLVKGRLTYRSPEQMLRFREIDQTTDIFSIGVILYELTTGDKPLGWYRQPSEINPEIPRQLDSVILKCLQLDPQDRYQSVEDLRHSLLSAVRGVVTVDDVPPLVIGSMANEIMGNCTFLETLRETVFGATYLVQHEIDGKLYVIKKMIRREMGMREAKLLATLDHPNINRVYGAGCDINKNVIISDYARGGSLAERIGRPCTVETALRIFKQIAEGLKFAHENKIVHGNLRPSNILFDLNDTVKLTDFALPEHHHRDKQNWYSAPERRRSKASDVYAAGAMLFLLLTGKTPKYDNAGNLIWQSDEHIPPLVISTLISRMLMREASARIESFEAVLEVVDSFQKRLEKKNAETEART
ncbi:MAG: serine/threonine-protein kinase [Candidatus Zixiibacteriota bacterium]